MRMQRSMVWQLESVQLTLKGHWESRSAYKLVQSGLTATMNFPMVFRGVDTRRVDGEGIKASMPSSTSWKSK